MNIGSTFCEIEWKKMMDVFMKERVLNGKSFVLGIYKLDRLRSYEIRSWSRVI